MLKRRYLLLLLILCSSGFALSADIVEMAKGEKAQATFAVH